MIEQKTMLTGAYQGAGRIELVEKPVPDIGPGDVLIKVSRAGICGTDMHTYRHGNDFMPEGLTIGHEFSGRIVAMGSNVDGFALGMRVTVNPMVHQLGLFSDGAFAEYVKFADAKLGENIFALPNSVDDTQAALAEPLAVALRGINQSRLDKNSTVLIQGLGTIGLCALLIARQRGVEKIVAIDAEGCRLDLAKQLGATTFALGDDSIDQRLFKYFGTATGLIPSPNIDLIIDATGSEAALNSAVNRLAPSGELLILGTYPAPVAIDMTFFVAKELRMIGSLAYEQELPQALDLIASAAVDVRALASHEFSLVDIKQAFLQQSRSAESIKVMINTEIARD